MTLSSTTSRKLTRVFIYLPVRKYVPANLESLSNHQMFVLYHYTIQVVRAWFILSLLWKDSARTSFGSSSRVRMLPTISSRYSLKFVADILMTLCRNSLLSRNLLLHLSEAHHNCYLESCCRWSENPLGNTKNWWAWLWKLISSVPSHQKPAAGILKVLLPLEVWKFSRKPILSARTAKSRSEYFLVPCSIKFG